MDGSVFIEQGTKERVGVTPYLTLDNLFYGLDLAENVVYAATESDPSVKCAEMKGLWLFGLG